MRGIVACGVVVVVVAVSLPLVGAESAKVTYLDLQPKANHKLKDGHGNEDNNLASLPKGEQTFGGVKFKVGEGLILLAGKETSGLPEKVEGIKLDGKCSRLHFLHATHYSTPKEDTIVGYYTVNYDDKSQETIPIVYGKDVLDWWQGSDPKEPTRGKVAWTGDNENAKAAGSKIRLFRTAWKNPEPGKKVVGIDFGSTSAAEPAPFCVAITAEE
ncbi:MAG: hypothetical protein U0797_16180 [Gemmataceae bacterium]